jgi:hypothetical protein
MQSELDSILGTTDEFSAGKSLVAVEPPHDHLEAQAKGRGGRPRGRVDNRVESTKSSVMKQRLALEAGLREYIAHPNRRKMLRDALDRIMRIAAYGIEDKDAVRAWAVLSDKLMSTAKQEEEAGSQKNQEITIVIENATVKKLPVIDGIYTEVKEA